MSAVKRPLAALIAVVGLFVAAFAFTTSASAYPDGRTASLSANASSVTQGGSITVTGTHFKGLVTLRANGIHGTVTVGTVTAGADGTFSTNITLPAGDFPPGNYTITATDNFGDVESITVSVVSAGAPAKPNTGNNSGLPNTGIALASLGGLGVLLLLGGGVMLLAGRRRQATV